MEIVISVILFLLLYWPVTLIFIITLILFFQIIKAYRNKHFKRIIGYACLMVLIPTISGLSIGYIMYPVDDMLEEPRFFLKKYPTIQVKFRDFYLDAGNIYKFSQMPATEKQQIANYCTYRYGYLIKTNQDIKGCIKAIHPNTDLENPNG